MMAYAGDKKRVLIIVENLPCPFDRRVWQEASTLINKGYLVSIICPVGRGYEKRHEVIDGIHIYRHPLPLEGDGPFGYLAEYLSALFWESLLAWKVYFTRGFDVIHACNPPDLIFLVAAPFKVLGKRFLFDHHDISPELYEAKFGKRGLFYNLLVFLEKMTFKLADVSIATNESYRSIAMSRGKMRSDKVFIVRSGPNLGRIKIVDKVDKLKNGRKYLVGYVGVIGKQEGVDYLIRAVNYIVKELGREDIQFAVVGSGTELECLRDYAKEIGVDEYITFYGRLPDAQLLEVLNTSDICVNPDVANEMNDKSTMNKIMEYMALAKPIVQFDLFEGRFSAQDSSLYAKRNDYVDMARKIVSLLDDVELRMVMGSKGRKRVEEKLSWDHQEEVLLSAYERVLA